MLRFRHLSDFESQTPPYLSNSCVVNKAKQQEASPTKYTSGFTDLGKQASGRWRPIPRPSDLRGGGSHIAPPCGTCPEALQLNTGPWRITPSRRSLCFVKGALHVNLFNQTQLRARCPGCPFPVTPQAINDTRRSAALVPSSGVSWQPSAASSLPLHFSSDPILSTAAVYVNTPDCSGTFLGITLNITTDPLFFLNTSFL